MLDTVVLSVKRPVMEQPEESRDRTEFPKLYVHRDVFEQLKQIQRSQHSPKFDLRDIGSSALRILLAMPNAPELIKQQVLKDFLEHRRT